MKSITLVIALVVSSFIYSQLNIIPQPESVTMGNGMLILPANTSIVQGLVKNDLQRSKDFLSSYLETFYKSWLGSSKDNRPSSRYQILLTIDDLENKLT